ncbi:MAG TPA: LEA type 2 family protein [Arenimonas sp.]|nr:LEA type 2 family protein [Arenimonas sp.]
MPLIRILSLLALSLLLAACASGPPKRIFPPQASIQELRVDGANWQLDLRIRNFSTIALTYEHLDGELLINGQQAARFSLQPALTIGPGSAEIFSHPLQASAAAQAAVAAAMAQRHSLSYRIVGRIRSAEPRREHDYEFESALDPVPGLSGVLR